MAYSLMHAMLHTPFNARTQWGFYNPVRLSVGRGCRAELLAQVQGKRLLLVTSKRGREQLLSDPVLGILPNDCKLHWVDTITTNPALADLQDCIHDQANTDFDAVIGFGGGSAMDAAKVLRLALDPRCRAQALIQLIANPKLHPRRLDIPLYTLPTTAGTGSEITPFATVWDWAEKKKRSLSSPSIFPTAAFVDSELTDGLPIATTLSTGLDAINQAAESIWNKNANSITIAYATRALQLGFASLPILVKGQASPKLRNQMVEASVLAGLAISHTRTALCHSISYPLTAHFGIPHGLACAFTMPAVLQYNLAADDGRFVQLAMQWLGTADTQELLRKFEDMHTLLKVREAVKVKIPSLEALLALESKMLTPGRSENNLREVESISFLLKCAWGGNPP